MPRIWVAYARTGPSHKAAASPKDHGTLDGKTTLCGLREIGGHLPDVAFPARSGADCARCVRVYDTRIGSYS